MKRNITARKYFLINFNRALLMTFCVALAGMLSGCGYRFGTSLPPGIRTVHIKPFANRSEEPDLENTATRATISEFIRDGTLQVVDASSADVVLHGAVTEYSLAALLYDEDTSATPEEYRLILTAQIKLVDKSTEETMLETTINGDADFFIGADLTSAKSEALPEAADDLARNIVDAVVEYW